MIYGYCRISTKKQNIERQIRNITKTFPDAKLYKEAYTGTTLDRPEFNRLLKRVKSGDTIIFDSISRMSRNVEDGISIYKKLREDGINLVFLKEPYANTECFVSYDLIEASLKQAEIERNNMIELTKEGIETARLAGKQIGGKPGKKLNIKKSKRAKQLILKYSKTFMGELNDDECLRIVGISRNTYYKYKKELKEEYCQ